MAQKYITSCGKLIHYSSKNKTFRVLNTLENLVYSKEEFEQLEYTKIKTPQFYKLLNFYFKRIKCEWTWNGIKYRKLDNFESDGNILISNYDWKTLPKHKSSMVGYPCITVWFRGKIYLCYPFYQGSKRCQLVDFYTKKHCQWTSIENLAPIQNLRTKEII